MLEVLDRRQRVAQRLRLDHLPLTIGRGLAADVVLDDPYVCPLHARIVRDPDGRLVAEDLDSVNGLYAHSPERRVSRVALDTTATLRLGRTTVRVRSADAPLAATLVDRSGPEAARPPAMRLTALCIAALALVGADAYLGSYAPNAPRDALSEMLVVLVLALAWSTGWAFVNRVLGHQWNLLGHLTVVCGFVVGLLILGVAFAYAGFLISAPRLVEGVEVVLTVLLLAALLSGHLGLVAPAPPARRRLSALGAAAVFIGLIEIMPRLLGDDFTEELRFGAALRPVPSGLLPTRSVDQFLTGLDGVRDEVDRLAKEPN